MLAVLRSSDFVKPPPVLEFDARKHSIPLCLGSFFGSEVKSLDSLLTEFVEFQERGR